MTMKMNKVEAWIMEQAFKFDQVSEQLINSKMCTDVCPCYSETDLTQPPPDNLDGADARATYW